MSLKPIRVVLADDHILVLEAFKVFLANEVDIVGTATDGRELIKLVKDTQPEVIVTDISMPNLNGLDAAIKLLHQFPALKFIFLTVNDDPDMVAKAMRAGAKGFVLKNSAASELTQAIKAVAAGSTYVTPLMTGSMIDSLMHGSKPDMLEKLTVRQREILQLLAEGKTMKEAAQILSLTSRTVAFHKYRIMETLDIHNSAELVRFAVKSGLLQS
jgi:DNA-binding NarL/FixJ family response regulator